MRHDPAFATFAMAALQAALVPGGTYFVTAHGVWQQLVDALTVVEWGECVGWTPAQKQLLAAARDALAMSSGGVLCPRLRPLPDALVRDALRDPWPAPDTRPAWQDRADIGDGPEVQA